MQSKAFSASNEQINIDDSLLVMFVNIFFNAKIAFYCSHCFTKLS